MLKQTFFTINRGYFQCPLNKPARLVFREGVPEGETTNANDRKETSDEPKTLKELYEEFTNANYWRKIHPTRENVERARETAMKVVNATPANPEESLLLQDFIEWLGVNDLFYKEGEAADIKQFRKLAAKRTVLSPVNSAIKRLMKFKDSLNRGSNLIKQYDEIIQASYELPDEQQNSTRIKEMRRIIADSTPRNREEAKIVWEQVDLLIHNDRRFKTRELIRLHWTEWSKLKGKLMALEKIWNLDKYGQ